MAREQRLVTDEVHYGAESTWGEVPDKRASLTIMLTAQYILDRVGASTGDIGALDFAYVHVLTALGVTPHRHFPRSCSFQVVSQFQMFVHKLALSLSAALTTGVNPLAASEASPAKLQVQRASPPVYVAGRRSILA
jgi:hypothetical protein